MFNNNLPGYDAWKLSPPPEGPEVSDTSILFKDEGILVVCNLCGHSQSYPLPQEFDSMAEYHSWEEDCRGLFESSHDHSPPEANPDAAWEERQHGD